MPSLQELNLFQLHDLRKLGEGPHPVFKARVGNQYVVLKGESREAGTRASEDPDHALIEEQRHRANFFPPSARGGAPLKVKDSFEVMADVYQHVTQDVGEFRLLRKDEVRRINIPNLGAAELGIRDPQDPQVMWYLMQCFESLSDLSVLREGRGHTDAEQAPVRALLASTPELFEDLGRIAVADLFVGNLDRFIRQNGAWRVNNMGNLFLSRDPMRKRARIIGIDFYDKSSRYTSFNVTIEMVEDYMKRSVGPEEAIWPGRILDKGQEQARDGLASGVVEHIKRVGAANLGDKHVKAMQRGMHKGRRKLAEWYKAHKFTVKDLPGLQSRFDLIHVENWSRL